MVCVIELQGYSTGRSFILKELCVLQGEQKYIYLVKCAEKYCTLSAQRKKMISWAVNNYHGLRWDTGDQNLQDVLDQVRQLVAAEQVIYTKGLEKAKFITEHFGVPAVDVAIYGCPSIRKQEYKNSCKFHDKVNSNCAVVTAEHVKKFMNGYFESASSSEKIKLNI